MTEQILIGEVDDVLAEIDAGRDPDPGDVRDLLHGYRAALATRSTGFREGLEAALQAQPSTAENPNESAYQRGRFDGIIEYATAIRALSPTPEDDSGVVEK